MGKLLFWRSLGDKGGRQKENIQRSYTAPPSVASAEDSDRDLEMYMIYPGAHLPTGLVLLLWLPTVVAEGKESDRHQIPMLEIERVTLLTEGYRHGD